MVVFEDETKFARDNLDYHSYRTQVEKYEEEFQDFADTLNNVKIDELEKRGYKLLTVDEIDILVPEDISFQKLYNSLQQMPIPYDRPDEFSLYYFVDNSDLRKVKNSDGYKNVISKRTNLLDKILDVYKEFWDDEVSVLASTDEESIIYFLAGIDRDVGANKISKVTGIEESNCKGYSFNSDGYVFKE